jgi:hypothetical protein
MLSTLQNAFVPLRTSDVTADDTAMDLSTAGERMTDITKRDVWEISENENGYEIVFLAGGADDDTFGCELWAVAQTGAEGGSIGTLEWDVTGTLGTAWADVTNADSTGYLFADDVTLSEQYSLVTTGVRDQGNNRVCRIFGDLNGKSFLYPRFYTVGGAGEAERINAWIRTY